MTSERVSNQEEEGEEKEEEEQSLLTSVAVVCREIPSFSTHPEVARQIEVFLDYAPQYILHRACWFLSLRLAKRVYLSQDWDQEQVVRGLSYAAMEGKLEVIKWLYKKEADKGVLTKDLITGFNQRVYCYIPVCMAAGDGHIHVLQWLVDNGADVNEKDYTGQMALLGAARGGHFSTVQWLIENGARVNVVDEDGDSVLFGAICTGNVDLAKLLVESGADVKQTNDAGMTALHYAVHAADDEVLVHYFLDQGLQIADEDKRGRTSVFYASATGNFNIMKFLLREGFKENKPPGRDLQFALVEAVKADRLDLVEYLNEYGVDLHFVNFRGWNVLHEAAAAAGGGVHLIEFLIEKGVDVHLEDKFGITPVMEACRHGHQEVLRCLLEAGGSISTVDLAGQSPLHLAAQGNHTSIVEELLERAVDIDSYDQRGWTPLHSAAATVKTCEVVELLVLNGAKSDAKTLSGQTAEDLAISRGHSDVATYLRDLRVRNTSTLDVSGPLDQADFGEYKEYLLDRTQVHFNSITTTMQSSADGSWLDAPIEVKVKKLHWSSKAFVEALGTWSQLNHPHVVKLYGYCHSDN